MRKILVFILSYAYDFAPWWNRLKADAEECRWLRRDERIKIGGKWKRIDRLVEP